MLMLPTTLLMILLLLLLLLLYVMRETHWYILNNLLLIQNLVTYAAFFKKRSLCYHNFIRIAYVDVANHNCDIVVVVDADGDPLISTFKITCYLFVTYSVVIKSLISRKSKLHTLMLPTANVMLLLLLLLL